MFKDAFFLARKDLQYLLRDWATWFWAFLMPVVFFYFIGTITGGVAKGPTAEKIGVLVEKNAGFLADEFIGRLEGLGYKADRVNASTILYYSRRIIIPAGFTENVLAGKQRAIAFSRTGKGLDTDYDEILVKRAAYSVLADLIAADKRTGKATPESFHEAASVPHTLTLEVSPAGIRETPPTGFQQAVPGTMSMFILLAMFTTGGITLHQERIRGILRRLASSPMSRSSVVLGKTFARLAIGIAQIIVSMMVGSIFFKVDWGPHIVVVVVVLCAYATLAALGGMLLGNFGKSEGQILAIGVISSNVLSAVGGCMWPVEVTPEWAQKVSLFLPTGWVMGAMHKLVSFGDSPLSVFPHLLALVAAAFAAAYLISRTFRFQ
jgi:ABC-2 type transport system permease protein